MAMEKRLPKGQPERGPESRVAVPIEVQIELAKQNQKLAELRYRAAVRRGRAWDAPSPRPK